MYDDDEIEELKKEFIFRDAAIYSTQLLVEGIINSYIDVESNKDFNEILQQIRNEINTKIEETKIKDYSFLNDNAENKFYAIENTITKIVIEKIYDKKTNHGIIFEYSYKDDLLVSKLGYQLDLGRNRVSLINKENVRNIEKYCEERDNLIKSEKTFTNIDIANDFISDILKNVILGNISEEEKEI